MGGEWERLGGKRNRPRFLNDRPTEVTVTARMRAYPSFDAYLAAQSPRHRAIIRDLRKFVKRTAPLLQEAVKWGTR